MKESTFSKPEYFRSYISQVEWAINQMEIMSKKMDSLMMKHKELETEIRLVKLAKGRILHVKEVSIELPDHLRLTYMTLKENFQSAVAQDIANITHRARAVESAYLNQLVIMGICKKERIRRIVKFMLVGDN